MSRQHLEPVHPIQRQIDVLKDTRKSIDLAIQELSAMLPEHRPLPRKDLKYTMANGKVIDFGRGLHSAEEGNS